MNDELIRLVVFALLGGFGGFVRLLVKHESGISTSVVIGHMFIGAIFAVMLPALCSLAEVLVRVVRHTDLTVAGGMALLIGLFAKSLLPFLGESIAPQSNYLRKILGFPPKRKQ